MNKQRCDWVTNDPEYLAYHDDEWGKPERDKYKLFEMICLEGQQAGLSWYTVLKKREGYRRCFFNFSPEKIAKMTDKDVEALLQDPAIIRHQGKINAIINNARIFMAMEEKGEDFSQFIWQFVDNKPIINQWNNISQVPASTEISDKMAKTLKKKVLNLLVQQLATLLCKLLVWLMTIFSLVFAAKKSVKTPIKSKI